MNIKFISSAGYQLWASEGIITRYKTVAVCSPETVSLEEGGLFVSIDVLEPSIRPIVEYLVPSIKAELENLPTIDASEIGPPKLRAFSTPT